MFSIAEALILASVCGSCGILAGIVIGFTAGRMRQIQSWQALCESQRDRAEQWHDAYMREVSDRSEWDLCDDEFDDGGPWADDGYGDEY